MYTAPLLVGARGVVPSPSESPLYWLFTLPLLQSLPGKQVKCKAMLTVQRTCRCDFLSSQMDLPTWHLEGQTLGRSQRDWVVLRECVVFKKIDHSPLLSPWDMQCYQPDTNL